MGLFDSKEKKKLMDDNFKLSQECARLYDELKLVRSQLSPEQASAASLENKIQGLQETLKNMEFTKSRLIRESEEISAKINEQKRLLIDVEDSVNLQDFGVYKPRFSFCNSDEYKEKLNEIRKKEKELIKHDGAVLGNQNWIVGGSVAEGNRMVKDMQKLLLRAFNSECDTLVEKVKYNNLDMSMKRIMSLQQAISKLGKTMGIAITSAYYNLKVDEITLAFEYNLKKQEEKEEQREIRARMREEAKFCKEIEEARKKVEKEQNHYQNALDRINQQIENATGEQLEELTAKKAEIESQLTEIGKAIKDIDYREANQRAGYVYVISNIGSFGENVYKIGMTRRLDPMERVDELGDASVPFNFDVHAMIFSEDAPALENALHKAFADRKVNMINHRREFFHVSLDEIKKVVKENYDKTVEFVDIPDAEQYRMSINMK